MFDKKRGLSGVVVTVLIVLLAIIAVVIVWAAIRPTIEGGAEEVASSGACLTLQLRANSCSANPAPGTGWNVNVQRNAGGGDLNDIRFIFEDASGSRDVVELDSTFNGGTDPTQLNELESSLYTGLATSLTPATVDIAYVVGSNNRLCDPVGLAVQCS